MGYDYDPELSASALIQHLGRLIRQRAAQHLNSAGAGVSPEQWGLLARLAARPGVSQSSLADPLLKDHANVTRLLDGLQRRGLIERRPRPGDRRSHAIHLTEAGQAFVDEFLPGVLEQKARWFDGLDRDQLEQMVRLLKTIEVNVRGPQHD